MVKNQWALSALIASQDLFVVFLNGGLMPISPETGNRLMSIPAPGNWRMGERLGRGKAIVLPHYTTRWSFWHTQFHNNDSSRTGCFQPR